MDSLMNTFTQMLGRDLELDNTVREIEQARQRWGQELHMLPVLLPPTPRFELSRYQQESRAWMHSASMAPYDSPSSVMTLKTYIGQEKPFSSTPFAKLRPGMPVDEHGEFP